MNYKDMYKKAEKAGETKAVSPTFVEFKTPGQQIIGRLDSIVLVESGLSTGTYNQYVVDTDEGMVKFHLGQSTDKEIAGSLKIGHVFAFTFIEVIKVSRGRTVNKYKVEYVGPGEPQPEGVDKEETF